MADGHVDCSWEHTEQKLWAMALILAVLKTKWVFFHGRMEGDGTLETKGLNSTERKLSTAPHSPMGASGNIYSHDTPRSPLPPSIGGDTESTSSKTMIQPMLSSKWSKMDFIILFIYL